MKLFQALPKIRRAGFPGFPIVPTIIGSSTAMDKTQSLSAGQGLHSMAIAPTTPYGAASFRYPLGSELW